MTNLTRKHPKSPGQDLDKGGPSSTSPLMAVLMGVTAVILFLLLLEGGLALFHVQPLAEREDPFVGFASNVPLYVPSADRMTTATSRLTFFNYQTFPREKAPNSYRIFTLGGSTTYGRPYQDATSFSGYLREMLPLVDSGKDWEVINAGGISYASYRVAHLMEELVQYQPDLFIIYTGHNEFLEERTYGQLKKIPSVVRSLISTLAKTRSWTALRSGLQKVGLASQATDAQRTRLSGEVNAILENSAGLDRYTRDDQLSDQVLEHFRLSLKRMVALARSAGAKIIFVTPAASLKDCSPFKSEYTDTLGQAERQRVANMLKQAKQQIESRNWTEALNLLSAAVALDPRYAELQYWYGQALFALGRYGEAEGALRAARDEDVCPLRALTPMPGIVAEVAREEGAGLVDYVGLIAERMREQYGHPIPGDEFFLDHVHPTITGHKLLSVALMDKMIAEQILQPSSDWKSSAIERVDARIRGNIDEEAHALALANLARVYFWAKKIDDAERLAQQALTKAAGSGNVAVNATSTLAAIHMQRGEALPATDILYSALERFPDAIELRLQLGQYLLSKEARSLEEAAANLLLVSRARPGYDQGHALVGTVMAMRGRYELAYPSLQQALKLNPGNAQAQRVLGQLQPVLQKQTFDPLPARIELNVYPSKAPRQLVQMRRNQQGREVPDGVRAEFYENGRLKRFEDLSMGQVVKAYSWDREGKILAPSAAD